MGATAPAAVEQPLPPPPPPPPGDSDSSVDTLASRANRKLAQALDLDESIGSTGGGDEETAAAARRRAADAYMEAAELYLRAIQRAEGAGPEPRGSSRGGRGPDGLPAMKRRLRSILDRVEAIQGSGGGGLEATAAARRTVIEQSKENINRRCLWGKKPRLRSNSRG
jgi:hypothetical protein